MTLATKLIIAASIFLIGGMALIGWLLITFPYPGISSKDLASHQKQFENNHRDFFGVAPSHLRPIEYDSDTNYHLYTVDRMSSTLRAIGSLLEKEGWTVNQDEFVDANDGPYRLKIGTLPTGSLLVASESNIGSKAERFQTRFLTQYSKLTAIK